MINVHFEAMDRQSMALVRSAEKMAKFLREHEPYRRPFCDVLRDSAKWHYTDCKQESDADLNDMRGIMPEQILLCQVKQGHCRNDGWRIETGCAVKINNQKIVCKASVGNLEKTKQTVDLGA